MFDLSTRPFRIVNPQDFHDVGPPESTGRGQLARHGRRLRRRGHVVRRSEAQELTVVGWRITSGLYCYTAFDRVRMIGDHHHIIIVYHSHDLYELGILFFTSWQLRRTQNPKSNENGHSRQSLPTSCIRDSYNGGKYPILWWCLYPIRWQ